LRFVRKEISLSKGERKKGGGESRRGKLLGGGGRRQFRSEELECIRLEKSLGIHSKSCRMGEGDKWESKENGFRGFPHGIRDSTGAAHRVGLKFGYLGTPVDTQRKERTQGDHVEGRTGLLRPREYSLTTREGDRGSRPQKERVEATGLGT